MNIHCYKKYTEKCFKKMYENFTGITISSTLFCILTENFVRYMYKPSKAKKEKIKERKRKTERKGKKERLKEGKKKERLKEGKKRKTERKEKPF